MGRRSHEGDQQLGSTVFCNGKFRAVNFCACLLDGGICICNVIAKAYFQWRRGHLVKVQARPSLIEKTAKL